MKKYKPTTKEELQELVRDESIHLGDIDTSLITDMSELFYWSDRKDFSGINEWDTSNVTDMSGMFNDCRNFNQALTFDTSNVTNMNNMFSGCENFNQSLDFNTLKVKDMSSMFFKCESFNKSVSFNTKKVINFEQMFYGCKNFNQHLKFNTKNVTSMKSMFVYCENFNQPLNFDTKKVINFEQMFYGCKNFKQKVNFNMSSAIYIDFMFDDEYIHELLCVNHSSFRKLILAIKRLCVGDLECIAVLYPKQALGFFKIVMGIYNRFNSTRLFFKNIKRKNSNNQKQYKPKNKKQLEKILYDDSVYLGDIDTSLITDMSYLFLGIFRDDFSGIEKWDTSNVVNMDSVFYNCMFFNKKLEWNTSKVTNMNNMFEGCINFNQAIEFDMTNVKHMNNMFKDCINLHPKNLKSFSKDEIIENFYYLAKLPKFIAKNKWIDMKNGKFKPKNKAELRALVYTDDIKLDKIDTSLITDMSYLFTIFDSKRTDFSGINTWDTSKVANMNNMFAGCKSLEHLPEFYKKFCEENE
ncbi:BspA family leucine-rich repeat surface protein [Campylobacter sp. RM12654]|uniref:BspA family leucine-rich repeat surface protein n=1 Tax=Campylobacter sp. RM12654 TaxID=2735738 RepID=UPI003014D19B|nr:BspA family leucine-rich repeat surface protein [Campylobacter sp. RM12654]